MFDIVFFEWMRTGSNPPEINQFRMNTRKTMCPEREGTMGCYTSSQSLYNEVFLFVGLRTLGTLVNFDWFVSSVECSEVSTTNFNL